MRARARVARPSSRGIVCEFRATRSRDGHACAHESSQSRYRVLQGTKLTTSFGVFVRTETHAKSIPYRFQRKLLRGLHVPRSCVRDTRANFRSIAGSISYRVLRGYS